MRWRYQPGRDVAAFDGAPGGTLPVYGAVADRLGTPIDARFRSACFVPSVSAVALQYDPVEWPVDLYTDITSLSPEHSQLDDYHCDAHNTEHGQVTGALADWILGQLGKQARPAAGWGGTSTRGAA
ncbi:hypothetical protein ABZW11_38970 [Nonomuraea sp. NPDC004580]|uniref:hypothetical protein n=1 Tax=Nonomuraea sp. NPDC004580 TaxID=3154552 RepID=UPI0033B52AA2